MKLIREIAQHLHNQGIGTLGTTLFYSHLPDIDAAFSLTVLDTGGVRPRGEITDIKSPTFQVLIRTSTYDAGKIKLDQVRDTLHGRVNDYLIDGGIYYRYIMATSEGGHIGKNEAGQDEFSINFMAEIIE